MRGARCAVLLAFGDSSEAYANIKSKEGGMIMALYAFDGTWNEDEEDNVKNTNVCSFVPHYLKI